MKRIIWIFLFFCFILNCQEKVKLNIFVENDWWQIPNWQNNRWFSGASSLNGWDFICEFDIGKKYEICGSLGWKVVFDVDGKGEIKIIDIEKGEYMNERPVLKESILNGIKTFRILLPKLYSVEISIPLLYGTYQIPGEIYPVKGSKVVFLPEGKFPLKGENGWSVVLNLSSEGLKIEDVNSGPFSSIKVDVKKSKHYVYDGYKIVFNEPENIYKVYYNVSPCLKIEKKLSYLPKGEYFLKSSLGFEIRYKVDEKGVEIIDVKNGPIISKLNVSVSKFKDGFLINVSPEKEYIFYITVPEEKVGISGIGNWYELSRIFSQNKTQIFSIPGGKYNILPLYGSLSFSLDSDFKVAGIGFNKTDKGLIGMKVEMKENKIYPEKEIPLKITLLGAKNILKNPFISLFIKESYSETEEFKLVSDKLKEGDNVFSIKGLEFGWYDLRICLSDGNPPEYNNSMAFLDFPYFTVLSSGIKGFVYIKDNREFFYNGERIYFSCILKCFNPEKGEIILQIDDGERNFEILRKKINLNSGGNTFNYFIKSEKLRPSNYTLKLIFNNKLLCEKKFVILASEPITNYKIHAYGGETKTEIIDALSEIGVNMQINNAVGPGHITGRIPFTQQRYLISNGLKDTYSFPVEQTLIITPFRKYLQDLTRNKIELIAQYGCAHQFFHYSTCFMDHEIQKTIARGESFLVQIGNDFPIYWGINLGDECGTPRGPTFNDDHCDYCLKIFEEKYNLKFPGNYWDIDVWKEWVKNPDIWKKWVIFKQYQLPSLIEYVKNKTDRIKNFPYHSQGGNLNYFSIDAGYPPISNKIYGFNTGHWYPHYGSTLWNCLGDEFMKMGSERVPILPLIWSCDDFYTTRHELYLFVARKVEGVGHFHIPAAIGQTVKKEIDQKEWLKKDVHQKLIKYGDFFLKLKREREKEIAVLFSFSQQIIDMFDCYDSPKAVVNYGPAYKQVLRAGGAFWSLLRCHFPASIISEEDILNGGLKERKALLICGVKNLTEDVIKKIEEYIETGGIVFLDKETTVKINRAKKIDFDFSEFYEKNMGPYERQEENWWKKGIKDDFEICKKYLPLIEEIFSKVYEREVKAKSPRLITGIQKSGRGKFIFCVNDNQVPFELRKDMYLAEYLPIETEISFKKGNYVVYDVFNMKKMSNFIEDDGYLKLPLIIEPGDMKVFALLQNEIEKIEIKPKLLKGKMKILISVKDKYGKPVESAIPVEIKIFDKKGNKRLEIYRATEENGICQDEIKIGINEGNYIIKVKELISGIESKFEISFPEIKEKIISEQGDIIIYRENAIKEFLKNNKEIFIVIDDFKFFEVAERFKNYLNKKGKKCFVKFVDEIIGMEFPKVLGRGLARTPLGVDPNEGRIKYRIPYSLIIIGNGENNRLLANLLYDSEITSSILTPDIPGRNKVMVDYVWCAFDYDNDSLIILSIDENRIAHFLTSEVHEALKDN